MSKVAFFPTIFAIALAILGLGVPIPGSTYGTPFMVAYHQQTMPDGTVANVDTIGFYLWGQQYTVVGTKEIQSNYVRYDQRDYPFYSFILMVTGIITGALALTVDRIYTLDLRSLGGKEYVWQNRIKPIYPLIVSVISTAFATFYLFVATSQVVIPALANSNYISNFSYGIHFMTISILAFSVSLYMTYKASKGATEVVRTSNHSDVPEIDNEFLKNAGRYSKER
jgi:hypothetical protein